MFKDKNSNEINELQQVRQELNNPLVEEEEKILSEEESLDWLVNGINNKINERIRVFFEDEKRNVEDYILNIDNNDGKVILTFSKEGEIVHTESFKA